jgi:diguanylate cyclase (GGDEF)-like protein
MEKKKADVLGKSVPEVWGRERFEASIKGYLDRCFEGEEVHYIEAFSFGPFEKHMHVSFYPYRDDDHGITHALVFSHDITHITEIESKLTNYEYRDPLTGLFNRRSLGIILDKEIQKAKRSESEKLRALLFISLKNFGSINRSHGHHIGDLLLENTALRIKKVLRNADFVFRFEGTDLTVLLTNIRRTTDAALVAKKISDAISLPYRYKEMDIQITSYIGVSLFPDDGESADEIIQNANSAVMQAKEGGKDFLLYNKELHEKSISRISLKSELQHAFEGEQFEMYYQPVVDPDGRIQGAEALIRWNHPSGRLVPPCDFIALAEETGLIVHIDRWALYSVCKQAAEWAENRDFFVSINISAREFADENLVDSVFSALKKAGNLNASCLRLELTESCCMVEPELSIEKMNRLRKAGISVYIDDFGTGHSSLSYLKRLPVDTVKIDKVFVDGLNESQEERDYFNSILAGIRARGKKTIVEGVDSPEQVIILKEMGCTSLQGYYFSKPVPAQEFARLLADKVALPERY